MANIPNSNKYKKSGGGQGSSSYSSQARNHKAGCNTDKKAYTQHTDSRTGGSINNNKNNGAWAAFFSISFLIAGLAIIIKYPIQLIIIFALWLFCKK